MLSRLIFAFTDDGFSSNAKVFSGRYGQIEIGAKYAGIEFHHSRPLPSRISFYTPVANSIDLSTDYWKRDQSMPLKIALNIDGHDLDPGSRSLTYMYTPWRICFTDTFRNVTGTYQYFTEDSIPGFIFEISLENTDSTAKDIDLESAMNMTLRTSHTYAWIRADRIDLDWNDQCFRAEFPNAAADSTAVLVKNSGSPANSGVQTDNPDGSVSVGFKYQKRLEPGETLLLRQIYTACPIAETDVVKDVIRRDPMSLVAAWEKRVMHHAGKREPPPMKFNSPELQETALWSRMVMAANRHYIDGETLPMPCPAEYNFFFTHDFLLTSLAAVFFDPDYVRNGFDFLLTKVQEDSVLAHAYYWKDSRYVTETCTPDNWNHLWFILTAASYLRHTEDRELLHRLFPVLHKSLNTMLTNLGDDGLMYARRPDWWDTGNIYGARAYITVLMSRALREYHFMCARLGLDGGGRAEYLELAGEMQQALNRELWDEDAGYLLNHLTDKNIDRHYYTGPLLAARFDLLNEKRKKTLIETAGRELLDVKIGIRNAMPPDFHTLIEQYHFNGMESGEPYVYFNGGVWPHGNAWYILAQIYSGFPEAAADALIRYMSLTGIQNSPNGQPSFYEYRMTDPQSPDYGRIDKPTFLWAGGWFLQCLYQLAGVRENIWNISFSPNIPDCLSGSEYELMISGQRAKAAYQGSGSFFRKIEVDGRTSPSAVIWEPAKNIRLVRGVPEAPYLAEANCQVLRVELIRDHSLKVSFHAHGNRDAALKLISSGRPIEGFSTRDGEKLKILSMKDGPVWRSHVRISQIDTAGSVIMNFEP